MKTQSIRFRGGVARVAAWHGRPEIASVALLCRGAPSIEAIEILLDQLRAGGYREVITNALAPARACPSSTAGSRSGPGSTSSRSTSRHWPGRPAGTRRSVAGDRPEVLRVDAAAFDDFWQLDDIGLEQAARATPRSHLRVTRSDPIAGYGLFGRAERTGYVQRLAIHPDAQAKGLGLALLTDGLHWMRVRGARSVFVNTQVDNERAAPLRAAGFHRLPVGLCVLGQNALNAPTLASTALVARPRDARPGPVGPRPSCSPRRSGGRRGHRPPTDQPTTSTKPTGPPRPTADPPRNHGVGPVVDHHHDRTGQHHHDDDGPPEHQPDNVGPRHHSATGRAPPGVSLVSQPAWIPTRGVEILQLHLDEPKAATVPERRSAA